MTAPGVLIGALSLKREIGIIVPGHDSVATPRDLEVHRDFMRDFLTYARQAKVSAKTPAAAAKAWKIPSRYAGYTADPVLVRGGLETIFRQLP